jgi:voltage-gated potassium channel
MEVLLINTYRAMRTLWSDPQFRSLTRLAVIAISSGTVFYWLVEDLRPIDSLYFSVTTLATVGYGDFAPKTDAGKLFTVVYMLVGVGILLAFLTKVAGQVVVSHLDHQQAKNGHGLRDRLAKKAAHKTER